MSRIPGRGEAVDHSGMKLGRKPQRKGLLLPRLGTLVPAGAEPPSSADWHSKVASWPMMGNDTMGCCTCAAVGHAIQQWTAYAGATPRVMTDALVQELYERFGYVPGEPDTDHGAVETDVLTAWANPGVSAGGTDLDRLDGFATVMPGDVLRVRQAIAWFGNLYVGLALPLSAQTQAVWDVSHRRGPQSVPGSWGGHAVLVVGYDEDGLICVTWGALKRMTWPFWHAYGDEAYALLSRDFVTAAGTDPGGLSWAELQARLAAMRPIA